MSDDKEEPEAILCKVRMIMRADPDDPNSPIIEMSETEIVLRPNLPKSYGFVFFKYEPEVEK